MSATRDDALRAAGELALAEARRLFELDVFDPPKGSKHPRAAFCLEVINEIMHRCGWRPRGGYLGNGSPQWCGMFAEDCWRAAGLDPIWFHQWFASTLRLHAWATYRRNPVSLDANPRPRSGAARLCGELAPHKPLPFEPRAGDIVIVGDGELRHITLVESYDPERRTFATLSGNGGGVGPHGDRMPKGGGIARAEYAIDRGGYRAMLVIRPAPSDLLEVRR